MQELDIDSVKSKEWRVSEDGDRATLEVEPNLRFIVRSMAYHNYSVTLIDIDDCGELLTAFIIANSIYDALDMAIPNVCIEANKRIKNLEKVIEICARSDMSRK